MKGIEGFSFIGMGKSDIGMGKSEQGELAPVSERHDKALEEAFARSSRRLPPAVYGDEGGGSLSQEYTRKAEEVVPEQGQDSSPVASGRTESHH